jgi:hypothetical protein
MPPNSPDGYAPLVVELSIQVGGPNGVTIPLPAHEYLQGIEVTLGANNAAWSAELSLFDQGSEALEDIIIAYGNSNNTVVRLRWAWDGPNGMIGAPTFVGQVMNYQLNVSIEGTGIGMELCEATLAPMFTDKKDRSWPAGTSITEIVRSIAAERGWTVNDVNSGVPTIQPSTSVTSDGLCMSGEDDAQFINAFLAPYALDGNGRGGYQLRQGVNGVVWFCNRYFVSGDLAAVYRFGRDAMGEVINFSPSDMSVFAALMTSGNVQYVSTLSDRGVFASTTTSYIKGVPGVDTTVIAHGGYRQNLGSASHGRVLMMERILEDSHARAASQYELMSTIAYDAELVVRGTHAIDVMDYVQVDYLKRDGTPHYLSGVFQVFAMKHSVTAAGWTTTMTIRRTGVNQVAGLTQIPASTTISPLVTTSTQQPGLVPSSFVDRSVQVPITVVP